MHYCMQARPGPCLSAADEGQQPGICMVGASHQQRQRRQRGSNPLSPCRLLLSSRDNVGQGGLDGQPAALLLQG